MARARAELRGWRPPWPRHRLADAPLARVASMFVRAAATAARTDRHGVGTAARLLAGGRGASREPRPLHTLRRRARPRLAWREVWDVARCLSCNNPPRIVGTTRAHERKQSEDDDNEGYGLGGARQAPMDRAQRVGREHEIAPSRPTLTTAAPRLTTNRHYYHHRLHFHRRQRTAAALTHFAATASQASRAIFTPRSPRSIEQRR